ncbi:MAG: helix-hairpin-helix domain-containing protein, partial [Chloroflexi bacterium]|nr:helix-hairpin-helix domain-containing protein [Chloroflexota bacterium]
SYDEDDYETVVKTVRRVRNENPELAPQSPTFLGQVRSQLPAHLQDMEAPALATFADVYAAPAAASPYLQALAVLTPKRPPLSTGSADIARDQALAGYRQGHPNSLQDAFSPDDAHRVAQLMDAYDDDDFAAVVYAVRAAREAQPDAQPASLSALQATRKRLPAGLQQMPSRDLAAFSRAFGTSAAPSALPDETAPPSVYAGGADAIRDTVVNAYRDGDEAAPILEQVFPPAEAREIRKLADAYARDDFDAVVKAVRQARTADPDMKPGSPYALRATRKLLPAHLRQMPSSDLTAFSRAFGESADVPTVGDTEGLIRPRPRSLRSRGQPTPSLPGSPSADTLAIHATSVDDLEAAPPLSVQYAAPAVPPAFASPTEQALGLDQATQPTPLVGLRKLTPAQRTRLENFGISSMELLADTPTHTIAATAKVDADRAQEWRSAARTVVRAQAAKTRQQIAQLEAAAQGGLPIQSMPGLGTRRIQRLASQNIVTMQALAAADPVTIAQSLGVSQQQVASWQQQAQSVIQTAASTTPAATGSQAAVPAAYAAAEAQLSSQSNAASVATVPTVNTVVASAASTSTASPARSAVPASQAPAGKRTQQVALPQTNAMQPPRQPVPPAKYSPASNATPFNAATQPVQRNTGAIHNPADKPASPIAGADNMTTTQPPQQAQSTGSEDRNSSSAAEDSPW